MRLLMWVEHGLNTGYTIVSSARLSSLFHRRDCQLPVGRINSPLDSREKRKNKTRCKSYILHFDVWILGYDTDSSCAPRSVREKTGNKLVFQEKTKGTLTLRIEPAKAAPVRIILTMGEKKHLELGVVSHNKFAPFSNHLLKGIVKLTTF